MRILHLSDVHVGVENYGRPATDADIEALPPYFAPGTDRGELVGVSTRLLDFLSTLDAAVAYALENGIELVLFAGDAYKSRDPSQTHQREFARRIARLASAGIPVFLTVGNHDLPHVSNRASALDIFPTLDVANVTVGSTLATHGVSTAAGDIQIVALPWIRIGGFMARDETRNMTLEEITRNVEDRLEAMLLAEIEALDPTLPAVLCAHVTVSGAKLSSERGLMLGNDHVLSLGTLANTAFDYVALGHIHKHQVLSQNPRVVYPGSLQRIDFSEEDDTKGFCVIDLDPARPRGERVVGFEFVPVDARPMLTIDVRARPGEDPTAATLGAIAHHAGASLDRSIVRLRVAMEADDEPAFRESAVRDALGGAHYVASIQRQVHRERRTRLGVEDAERLGPIDALRRYFDARSMPKAREDTLVRRAETLLQEEMDGAAD